VPAVVCADVYINVYTFCSWSQRIVRSEINGDIFYYNKEIAACITGIRCWKLKPILPQVGYTSIYETIKERFWSVKKCHFFRTGHSRNTTIVANECIEGGQNDHVEAHLHIPYIITSSSIVTSASCIAESPSLRDARK
jgi:hypothetical protein